VALGVFGRRACSDDLTGSALSSVCCDDAVVLVAIKDASRRLMQIKRSTLTRPEKNIFLRRSISQARSKPARVPSQLVGPEAEFNPAADPSIKCCVDRLRPPGQSRQHLLALSFSAFDPTAIGLRMSRTSLGDELQVGIGRRALSL
jgi:hypothetical protein